MDITYDVDLVDLAPARKVLAPATSIPSSPRSIHACSVQPFVLGSPAFDP